LGSLGSDYAELHAVTKSELIDKIAENLKLPAGKAEAIVNCVFDSMVKALEVVEGIEIRGFGSFTVREYKSYEGRNPRTGAPVHVPPKRLPFFKVGKDLRERVNASAGQPLPADDPNEPDDTGPDDDLPEDDDDD
jgi:integration host factor subunit beta